MVVYDATAWGDAYLAVGKGIERVNGLVARYSRCQVDKNLHLVRCVVVNLAYLYLSVVNSLKYRLYDKRGCLSERDLADGQCLVVLRLRDFCTYAHASAPVAVIVA